jgi:hypothetical protein
MGPRRVLLHTFDQAVATVTDIVVGHIDGPPSLCQLAS